MHGIPVTVCTLTYMLYLIKNSLYKSMSQDSLQIAPFKEIKKDMAAFNKITLKHLRPFFCSCDLQLENM